MPLAEGQRLGPYEVLGRIGAGGMGEVYRARDTRLDRTVALKVLPSEFSQDAALRSRFEREARAISALAHPHICTLFDVGEQDGQAFIVMEHLEGQTLLERIGKGALPLAQAVGIATQVAEALSAAHKQGIVHRDLKPGNVMLTKAGAKLLDFGLARQTTPGDRPEIESLTAAPTKSAPLTGQGTILGTLPYMAPEQVEGKPTDARTDLWALGLLIYEMLTGRRAFEGRSQVSLIGAILEREPEPLGRLQPLTPPSLERLVKRCLAKSPDDRWDTAHDVAEELRWIAEVGPAAAEGTKHRPPRRALGLGVAALVGVLLGVLAERWLGQAGRPAPPVVRTQLDIQPAEELNAGGWGGSGSKVPTPGGSNTALTWTPDGRALVFVGRRGGIQQLYIRDLSQNEAQPLAGTEEAQAPAVSTDGRWVAFWAKGEIRRAPIAGGPTSVLVPGLRSPPMGMTWGPSGRLYYGVGDDRIWRVIPEGTPGPVTTLLTAELTHSLPEVLPGERAVLFTVRRRVWTWGDEEVAAQDLATGERKVLLREAVDARYVPGGYLVFMRQGVLMAVSFDVSRLTVRGQPVPLVDGVGHALSGGFDSDVTGSGQFAVATSGTLAYLARLGWPAFPGTLATVDRQGRMSPLTTAKQNYLSDLDLAPDGRRLAVAAGDFRHQGIWIVDTSRGSLEQLVGEGEPGFPRWTPDGQRVAYMRLANGVRELVWQRADGTGPAEPLARGGHHPSSWSPDGQHLATVLDGDLWMVTVAGATTSLARLSETQELEGWPEFSPDGRWLAYGSNATGRSEIYVQPWPGRAPRQQVSLEGGVSPAWNPNGHELFYASRPDGARPSRMWAVDVSMSPRLHIGTPRPLFEFPQGARSCVPVKCYSVSPDGRSFFFSQRLGSAPLPPVTQVRLVQGWLQDVTARISGEAAR